MAARAPLAKNSQSDNAPASKFGSTLRGRLILALAAAAIVPTAIAGILGSRLVGDRSREASVDALETNALQAAALTDDFLEDAREIPRTLSESELFVGALKSSIRKVEAEGLAALPPEVVDARYAQTGVLQVFPELNRFLEAAVQTTKLSEVILTESHGINVALNAPTEDVVQSDEDWWQKTRTVGNPLVLNPAYDESTDTIAIEVTNVVRDPGTGELLGVLRAGVPADILETTITAVLAKEERSLERDASDASIENLQIIDAYTKIGEPLVTVSQEANAAGGEQQTIGGDRIQQAAVYLRRVQSITAITPEEASQALQTQYGLNPLSVERADVNGQSTVLAVFEDAERVYSLAVVRGAPWAALTSTRKATIAATSRELNQVFLITGVTLATATIALALLLARQLSKPLTALTAAAQKVAGGDLEVRAEAAGTVETRTLATSFNDLVVRVRGLLSEQVAAVEEQRQQREELEASVANLMEEIEAAADGDLTVRANLIEGDVGIIADLFNAIIENLQETAQQVKNTAGQVSSSLGSNEGAIRAVADKAISEADEIRNTLGSIETMNRSILEVADNAGQAAVIANDAFTTAREGDSAMEQTVRGVLNLRSTIGETSKKMKRLGESAQKISQVVSLIDEIALKTNLLAINASVEANRAGEMGQGFTAVAQQVGSLAEQSAAAAKEIARAISEIQLETQEAIAAMEQGTAEVVDNTRLVETTKQRLADVLNKSQEIDNLMRSISTATTSQAETSQVVATLMQQVTEASEARSQSSREVAEAIQSTAAVAQSLESSVKQFKVESV